jgi:hypothetical protein
MPSRHLLFEFARVFATGGAGVAPHVRHQQCQRRVAPPRDGWSALVRGSPVADKSAAACVLAEPWMPANRSAGSRLDGSGCPVRRGGAEVFVHKGDALVVSQTAVAVSLDAANAGLLLRRRAAAAAPATRRLGNACTGQAVPVAASRHHRQSGSRRRHWSLGARRRREPRRGWS